MRKIREWLLIDEWIGLFVRNMYSRRMQREIRRALKYKIKYEVSKEIANDLRKDFCRRYPDSPLNKE